MATPTILKRCLLPLLLLLLRLPVLASPSDSIDVHHYHIHIDSLLPGSQSLRAHTTLHLSPRVNSLNTFTLDLLKLTVDSITVNGAAATWTYNDTLLRVHSPATYNPADTLTVTVWYQGAPRRDGSGFGGFYFASGYIYNIGVGFLADPHNYGRVWFPCKDNFTDKSTYDFSIRVAGNAKAVCNGTLQNVQDNGDGTFTWNWNLRDPIPTYLASMAVANYINLPDEFVSITGDTIPIGIYVLASDSADVLGSFPKLKMALSAFENQFGPYPFERVGYVGVPFNGGAMEHAANIAYPVFAINGNLSYETLWAHELSHAWFGDQVTCTDAPEMWLNEGFASYCEALFTESAYGAAAYTNYVRANHADVLRKAHYDDNGYHAVSGVSHNNTYGSTVYNKGASVLHTLRWQMGSQSFFNGVTAYLQQIGWGNADTDTLENELEAATGQNLTAFFDGWVQQPGFPHFQVDSLQITPVGMNYEVKVFLRQRLKAATTLLQDVRLPLRFLGPNREAADTTLTLSGALATHTLLLPFSPIAALCDPDERLCDATTDNSLLIGANGTYTFPFTYMSAAVSNLTDTLFLRITHNWLTPDGFQTAQPGVRLADRYWKVETVLPLSADINGTFTYNGRPGSGANNYLDNTWLSGNEDSLFLLWRPGPGVEWAEVSSYTVTTGSLVDQIGTVTVTGLKAGEYTLALHVPVTAQEPPAESNAVTFTLYPNPTQQVLNLDLGKTGRYTAEVLDMQGRLMHQDHSPRTRQWVLQLPELVPGTYFLRITAENGKVGVRKFIVEF